MSSSSSSGSTVVIITGGGGFLGQCLASSLLETGTLLYDNDGDNIHPVRIIQIILADIHFPPSLQPKLQNSPSVITQLQGDISKKDYCDSLFLEAISQLKQKSSPEEEKHVSIFHLGAVMSGDGERDFDLCMNVNLYGFLNMMEGARTHLNPENKNMNGGISRPAKFVFTSAGATIGSGDPTDYVQKLDTIQDSSRATPHTTYGMSKACCELMLSDYARRNFIDGRGVRLPTIVVRAGKPNAATTGCFSSIIREPLNGIDVVLPIAKDVQHAVTGTRAAINAMICMHNVSKERIESTLGFDRTVFLPAVALSLGQLEEALLKNIVAPQSLHKLGSISYQVDDFLSNVVGGFPTKIDASRALSLGVPPAPDAETFIREYIQDFPDAIVKGLEILPQSTSLSKSPSISAVSSTPKENTKVAVITGGGSGIGRAVALRLAKEGWSLALAGRTLKTLQETAQLCQSTNNDAICICIPTDVSNESQVQHLFAETERQFGHLDLLFNNAGVVSTAAPIQDVSMKDFERVYKINVVGPFLCAREAIKVMSKKDKNGICKGGRIINNGSISAQTPRPGSTCYTTSKHAILGLTKCIALDGRDVNVACGQIDFGNVVSEMSLKVNDSSKGAKQANGTMLVEASMNLTDAAETLYAMVNLPIEANILQMTVMATKMPFVGRG